MQKNGLIPRVLQLYPESWHSGSAFLTISSVQDPKYIIVLVSLKTCSCVLLHMVTQPEISVPSASLSQNILGKRELTVFVSMALF